MKNNPILLNKIYNTPLAIDPSKAQVIMNVMAPRMGLDLGDVDVYEIDARMGQFEVSPDQPTQVGPVMVIPITGTLVHRTSGLGAISGIQSYQSIAADLNDAMNDSSVQGILLDMNSFGGEVSGLFDLADTIYEMSQEKPIWAISNENAYSAAYGIASAANKLFLSRTAGVGSIGVIAQHVSFERQNEMMGIKVTPVFAGAKKNDLSADFDPSDRALADLQSEVDRIYQIFVSTVARNRQLKENAVFNTEAGVFFGQDAVQIGLADGIGTFDDVLDNLLDELSRSASYNGSVTSLQGESKMRKFGSLLRGSKPEKKGAVMNDDKIDNAEEQEVPKAEQPEVKDDASDPATANDEPDQEGAANVDEPAGDPAAEPETPVDDAPIAAADPAEVVELAVAAGAPSKAAAFIRQGLTIDQVKKELDVSKEIMKLCKIAGEPKLAQGFIDKGLTVAEVQDQLVELKADKSEAFDISGQLNPGQVSTDLEGADGRSVMQADIERRQKEWEEQKAKRSGA